MNLPITSRIKRSPLLKDKQDPNVKAKASAVTEGEKKDVTTTETVKGAKVEKFATTPEEIAKYKKYKAVVDDFSALEGIRKTKATRGNIEKELKKLIDKTDVFEVKVHINKKSSHE